MTAVANVRPHGGTPGRARRLCTLVQYFAPFQTTRCAGQGEYSSPTQPVVCGTSHAARINTLLLYILLVCRVHHQACGRVDTLVLYILLVCHVQHMPCGRVDTLVLHILQHKSNSLGTAAKDDQYTPVATMRDCLPLSPSNCDSKMKY